MGKKTKTLCLRASVFINFVHSLSKKKRAHHVMDAPSQAYRRPAERNGRSGLLPLVRTPGVRI